MPYSFIHAQLGSDDTAGHSELTVAKPNGTVENDVMIAIIAVDKDQVNTPSGWTLRDTIAHDSSYDIVTLTKLAGASEPADYTFTFVATSSASIGAILAYRDLLTSFWDAIASTKAPAGGGGVTTTCPPVTVALNLSLVVRFMTTNRTSMAVTVESPATLRVSGEIGSGATALTIAVADEPKSAGASGTIDFTSTNNTSDAAGSISLKVHLIVGRSQAVVVTG